MTILNLNHHHLVTVYYINVRGNFTDLQAFMLKNNPDTFAFYETNLHGDIQDSDFQLPGYLPIHCKDLVTVEINGIELPEETSFHLLALTFSRSMDWKPYIESIAKAALGKVDSLYRAQHFFTPESILYLYKSTIWPWSTVPISGVVLQGPMGLVCRNG